MLIALPAGLHFGPRSLAAADPAPSAPATAAGNAKPAGHPLPTAVSAFVETLPLDVREYAKLDRQRIAVAAGQVEAAAYAESELPAAAAIDDLLARAYRLEAAHAALEQLINFTFGQRRKIAQQDFGPARQKALEHYLVATSLVVELSGRVHAHLVETELAVGYRTATVAADRRRWIASMLARKSRPAVAALSWMLVDPPADRDIVAATEDEKLSILKLIVETGRADTIGRIVRSLFNEEATPDYLIAAADTLWKLGLPQDPRPGEPGPSQPEVVASELLEVVAGIAPSQLSPALARRRAELIRLLTERRERGLVGDSYRIGNWEIRPGDWLLLRNPSPYNLFTTLSPGLFTHVGVAAIETGSDGKRRMVIVEMRERGKTVPATNVELYLRDTLHFCFLRHDDPQVAAKLGEVAASVIGNPSEFDLDFRTDRVRAYQGQPLAGQRIKTYCAGFLLLCAQETGRPRSEFFPIDESPVGEYTVRNLGLLGLRLGDGIISPTGPLFAERMQIVARREAMYDPFREIEEAIYAHFAAEVTSRPMTPSPDLFQSLRLRMAKAAEGNPLLAQALAAAANVQADIDLVSAAQAAAALETLDDIAWDAGQHYRQARAALLPNPSATAPPPDAALVGRYRTQHAELTQRQEAGQLSRRALQQALVDYYIAEGVREVDARFFPKK